MKIHETEISLRFQGWCLPSFITAVPGLPVNISSPTPGHNLFLCPCPGGWRGLSHGDVWEGRELQVTTQGQFTDLTEHFKTHLSRIFWERIHAGAFGAELCLVFCEWSILQGLQCGGTTDLCCFTPTCYRPSLDLKVPWQQRFWIYSILGFSGWKLIMAVDFTWMLWRKKGKKNTKVQ